MLLHENDRLSCLFLMMPTGMALYRLPLDKERLLSLELRPPWQFYRNGSGSSNRWKKSNVKLSGVG
jgi:hypothetical protein